MGEAAAAAAAVPAREPGLRARAPRRALRFRETMTTRTLHYIFSPPPGRHKSVYKSVQIKYRPVFT